MKRAAASALLVLLGLMVPTAMLCQDGKCDSTIRPLPDSPFGYKDRGNRCEGLYVVDVGARVLTLVAVQQGDLSYQLRADEKLRVLVPGQAERVHVRAVALPVRTYYQMDAIVQPSSSLIWPVDDVLRPENLTSDRIGIFGWKGDAFNRIFVPVRVETTLNGQMANRASTVFLMIRTAFDVDVIKWRSAPMANQHCSVPGPWRDASSSKVIAGQPVRLNLAGLYGAQCVELAALAESSNEWSTLQIRLELPKQ